MPRSDTDLSMPGCLYPSKPKYTVTSCPIQASGICSAIAPPSSACSATYYPTGAKVLRSHPRGCVMRTRAVCTTVDRLRYSLYESLFDGSKGKGACRCRPRHSQKRDSPHARSLRAHRKALSQIEKGDGIGGTEASSQTPFLDRPERPTQKGLVEPARRT